MMLRKRRSERKVLSILLAFMLLFNFTITTIGIEPTWPVEYPPSGPAVAPILLESGQDETSVCDNPVRYESNFQTDAVNTVQIDGRDAYEVALRKLEVDNKKVDFIGWRILDSRYEMKGVVIKSGNDYNFYDYTGTMIDSDVNLVAPSKNISLLWFCVGPKEVPEEYADIAITKSVDAEGPVNTGASVIFTITATNDGPDAATGVVVNESLPAGLDFVSYTGDGTYDDTTGIWTVGSLANGASATLEITADVTAEPGSILTNIAVLASVDQNDENSVNDSYSASVTVFEEGIDFADIAITKEVDAEDPVNTGESVTFTITATNDGPDAATGVEVEDIIPAGLDYVSNVPSVGIYDPGTGIWTVGSLANGASATLGITVEVSATAEPGSEIINTTTVNDLDQIDENSVNDSDSASVTVFEEGTGTLRVWKEILGEFGGEPLFPLVIEDSERTVVGNLEIKDGLPEDATLPDGTYYIKETISGPYFELEGYYLSGEGWMKLTPKIDGYVEVTVYEGETTEVLVKNTVLGEPEDNLIIRKEVSGEEGGGTEFTIEVRNATGATVWMTFPYNGDSGDTYLPAGTYNIEEIDIPNGFELEGYYYWNGDGWTALPTENGIAEVELSEEEAIEVLVRNEVVSTPPPNGGGDDDTGEDMTIPYDSEDTTTPEEPVVVEEPAPEVIVEETEPVETTNLVEEPVWIEEAAPALPDTGGNNTMVRVLGTIAILSGAVLTMTDRKRTE